MKLKDIAIFLFCISPFVIGIFMCDYWEIAYDKDPEIYTRTKLDMDFKHAKNPDGSVTVYKVQMTGWIPRSALEPKIIWQGSEKEKFYLYGHQVGLREDGLVVWRKTKK